MKQIRDDEDRLLSHFKSDVQIILLIAGALHGVLALLVGWSHGRVLFGGNWKLDALIITYLSLGPFSELPALLLAVGSPFIGGVWLCLGAFASTFLLVAGKGPDLIGAIYLLCNPPMFLLGCVVLILNKLGWWKTRTWDSICESFRRWNRS